MQNTVRWSGALLLSVLVTSCGGDQGRGIVARAGSHRLTVDDAVELLAANPNIRPDPAFVQELAEMWTDYTLIALAAREDSSLSTVGLDAILDLQARQVMINRFVEQESPTDTLITEAELLSLWDANPPRGQVRASHILMRPPAQAADAQWDSVRGELTAIRERALRGESFGSLAERYSVDTSAEFQGDLGWFGPGDMVRPFNDAVYSLELGEISEIVRSAFGLHVIQLIDRRDPVFEEVKDAYRQTVVSGRLQDADSLFMATVVPEIKISKGAIAVTKEIGKLPRTHLNGRAQGRVLADFEGGELVAGEVWDFLQTLSTTRARALGEASDEQVEEFLQDLARVDALAALATEAGVEVTQAERDSIGEVARQQVVQAADMMGLRLVSPEPGETGDQTVDRVIRKIVREVIANQREPVALNGATIDLRKRFDGAVVSAGVQATVHRLNELRGTVSVAPPPVPAPVTPSEETADTTISR